MENEFEKINIAKTQEDAEEVQDIANFAHIFNKDDDRSSDYIGGKGSDMNKLIHSMLKNAEHQAIGKESESGILDDAYVMSQPDNELRRLAELKRIIDTYKMQKRKLSFRAKITWVWMLRSRI
jgi:hypothetical protein